MGLRVLVVDDNADFLNDIVSALQLARVNAEGLLPTEFLRRTKPNEFDYDMVFLDMNLGKATDGSILTAKDLLVHLITCSPATNAVVFTGAGISVGECIACIQLGALGIIPKSSNVEDYVQVATVYMAIGDTDQAHQEVIWLLRAKISDPAVSGPARGRLLEKLMINLFNTVVGFRVVEQHRIVTAGEIDFVVRNLAQDDFWRRLQSYFLVVECKSGANAVQKKDYLNLQAKIKARGSRVGIMVSMAGVSQGFKDLQSKSGEHEIVFYLDRADIEDLISNRGVGRENRLRQILRGQLPGSEHEPIGDQGV